MHQRGIEPPPPGPTIWIVDVAVIGRATNTFLTWCEPRSSYSKCVCPVASTDVYSSDYPHTNILQKIHTYKLNILIFPNEHSYSESPLSRKKKEQDDHVMHQRGIEPLELHPTNLKWIELKSGGRISSRLRVRIKPTTCIFRIGNRLCPSLLAMMSIQSPPHAYIPERTPPQLVWILSRKINSVSKCINEETPSTLPNLNELLNLRRRFN